MKCKRLIDEDETLWEGIGGRGGYDIVEAENLDEAIAVTARHPGVRTGRHPIEGRPIKDWPARGRPVG